MRWYGKEIYCVRGETFSIDCSIKNRDGTPYRIHASLPNCFFLLTVSSTNYVQENRYILYNWINLADFPKVSDMEILKVLALPNGDDLVRHRVLYNENDKKYYIYDDNSSKYIEYDVRFVHTFVSAITKDWIDQTYEYELHLLSGDLKREYIDALNKNIAYDKSPFSNVLYDFEIIPKTKIYVANSKGAGDAYD